MGETEGLQMVIRSVKAYEQPLTVYFVKFLQFLQ